MTNIENKLIEIETKLAFQEQTIEQLNDVIVQQQKYIDVLQRQFKHLNTKVQEESHNWQQNSRPNDEVPPHW